MPKVVPEYKDEAKKRIISAALEVMGEKGYSHTTMEDIASHMGVSKGAIYQYFKTRDELLASFVRKMHEKNLETAKRSFPGKSPLEAWTILFDQYMNLDDQYNALFFEIIAISARNETVKEVFSQEIMSSIEYCIQGLTSQQRKGCVTSRMDTRTMAVAITSLFIGMRSLVVLGADRGEIRRQWIEIARVILGVGDER